MTNSILDQAAFRLYELKAGQNIRKRLAEINRTQWLSHDALIELQHGRLQRLVEYAYQYVPYYRRTFDETGFKPGDLRKDITNLTKLPVLKKSIIRENLNDLLTTEPGRRQQMHKSSTSGSTGKPVVFKLDNDFSEVNYAENLRRFGWAGWKPGEWQAWIWGFKIRLNTSMTGKMTSRLLDWVQKRFVINAYEKMTDQTMAAFVQKIHRHEPSILFGYASRISRVAQYIKQSSFEDISFKGIFTTAEVLPISVRNFIEAAFRTRVFNAYGSNELGCIACECEAHTGMHVGMENTMLKSCAMGLLPDRVKEETSSLRI